MPTEPRPSILAGAAFLLIAGCADNHPITQATARQSLFYLGAKGYPLPALNVLDMHGS